MSREAMQMALEALERYGGVDQRACDAEEALRQALETDLARVGEVGVWGGVQCEPQEEVEDGWCDWVCPKPRGYLMQCCDCELIHEVDFRVVRYESEDSEAYAVVDDPNLQAQMRLRRRDDLSPKREWVGLTDEEINSVCYKRDWTAPWTNTTFARAIEAKLKDKNGGEYRNGATTERTKLNQENI